MRIAHLIIGLFLLVLGGLSYIYPWFLSGLNMLSSQEKKQFNEKRLKKGTLGGLSLLGLFCLVFAFIPMSSTSQILFIVGFLLILIIWVILLNMPYFKKQNPKSIS